MKLTPVVFHGSIDYSTGLWFALILFLILVFVVAISWRRAVIEERRARRRATFAAYKNHRIEGMNIVNRQLNK